MNKLLNGFSLIELLIAAAIVFIVGLLVIGVGCGVININDPATLCKLRGGVPSIDREGLMTRCDFPVSIYRR